jgi:hypothetical protein
MEGVLVLAFLLVLVSAVAPAVYAMRRRIGMPTGRLELWRVLERRGLSPAEAAGEPRQLGIALRRCALCPSVAECNRWLDLGARKGLADFCPNADYIRKLERG